MSSVSETIVREYFELHEFLVRQHRKYIAQNKREEDDIDFFVLNPRAEKREGELPFVLTSSDIPAIERAIVAVKGWHTETFSSSRIASTPEIFRFVGTKVFQEAARDRGAIDAFQPDHHQRAGARFAGAPRPIIMMDDARAYRPHQEPHRLAGHRGEAFCRADGFDSCRR